ncbi:hypothetical protein ACNQ17_00115 [Mycoplasma sp. Sp48II]|uniref:hypothetical protein n=1 Tax=unclassified Mycoplasma TaxID=2683645 RepID=UPI003A8674F1
MPKQTTTKSKKTKKSKHAALKAEMQCNSTTSLNDKRFTKLVDSIIIENQQDEFEIKKYRKNKWAYFLAIGSIILIIALVVIIILAIVYKWAG